MKSKTLMKLITLIGITFSSMPTYAMDMNVTVDPSLLTSGNFLDFTYVIYSCDNKAVCGVSEHKEGMAVALPADRVPEFLQAWKNVMKNSELPARSSVHNQDSYISVDIIKNGIKLALPNCTKVISGLHSATINVTPTGCLTA